MADTVKVIGIDIGGSTTKIIGFDGDVIFGHLLVKATDPIASVYGAFGKFLSENRLSIGDVDRVMVTGVGSSFISEPIYGIPTGRVDEFRAIGMGGLFMSGLPAAIVVSMGTGTALVSADAEGVRHMGGTGVGGGTLLGLSNRMLNIRNFDDLIEAAQGGSLAHVDLTISDITKDVLHGLPPETTASNFGKMNDLASRADVAMGIINLVFQTIGMIAVFATRTGDVRDVVLTGNLVNVPQAASVFDRLTALSDVQFHTPESAEYATAAGTAIVFRRGMEFREV